MSDSEFNFWLGFGGGIAIGIILFWTLLIILYDGMTPVDIPKFGTALCEGMNLEYNNYINDEVLKINCIDKGTTTKPLIDGVVSVTKRSN